MPSGGSPFKLDAWPLGNGDELKSIFLFCFIVVNGSEEVNVGNVTRAGAYQSVFL
jgi:hypothetical protein